jgi:hypothetical protein
MRRAIFATLLVAVAAGASLTPQTAVARDRYYHDHRYHDRWHHEYRNYRDARRAGVVAGVVVGGVAEAAARDRAEERYRDCVMATGYDYECDRRRQEDEYRARRAGRRAGVVSGVVAHDIVRH